MQGSGGLVLSMPTPIEHRTASQTERNGPAPSRNPLIQPPTSPVAFCVSANLPNYPLDRLSRYEAMLWRQTGQILFALNALDRRKPLERGRRFRIGSRQDLSADGRDNC